MGHRGLEKHGQELHGDVARGRVARADCLGNCLGKTRRFGSSKGHAHEMIIPVEDVA
jgi:hypothetical protein